jgi:hypothetical protein
MAYAATLVVVVAILFLAVFAVFKVIAREVPEDREHEIEIKFGPATIRLKVGSKPDEHGG